MTITRGTKPKRGARTTIEDVAEMAGVSVATVSRVVNGHPDVSPTTRTDVLKFAREMGYVSNRAQSAPNTNGRSVLIAVSVPQVTGAYIPEITTGASEFLRDQNAHLVICSAGPSSTPSDSLRERLLEGTTAGGLLIMPSEETADLRKLTSRGYPLVCIEPTLPVADGIPTVTVTNWAGAKMATEFLIGLGHVHVGVVSGPRHLSATADRLAGYQAALLSQGLPLVEKLIEETPATIDGGHEAASKLLDLPHVPSAIFALSDVLAIGVLRAARERSLHVPRELSVVGFGDTDLASVTVPSLTTMRQPLQGLGRVGADMLWRLLQGQQLDAPRIELSTTLVERESTSPPRGSSFSTM